MKKLVFLIAVSLLLTIINGCQKDNEFFEETVSYENAGNMNFSEGQMILGEKLRNPYSVENMQKAYNNLYGENKLKSAMNIETTHYYVRFRPKNHREMDVLTRDTTIYIYDYPLDVEIKRGGTHYHDPSIPQNEITWQYTVVPIDYSFPDIQYQKLADLYLQDETGEFKELKSGSLDYLEWIALEREALRITGNLDENENENELKSSSWRPSGTIKVYDDIINSYTTSQIVFDHYEYYNCRTGEPIQDPYPIPLKSLPLEDEVCERAIYRYETKTVYSHLIPMEGVTVRANRWFTTYEGMTDANGKFSCNGTFSGDVNYSIKWERWDFDIRDGSYGQAYFNAPSQTGPWNLNIEKSTTPKSHLFAHIFRAAFTYYYKNSRWGIKTPPRRDGILGTLQHRLHIAGRDYAGQSHYFDWNDFFMSAQVIIYSKYTDISGSSYYNDTRTLFGTTIHELAHASHWEVGYSGGVWLLDKTMGESWATGVEWVITNDVYSKEKNYLNDMQFMTISSIRATPYTPIVIDLIDNKNQRNHGTLLPNDQVEYYTLSQLEWAIILSPINWWGWRDKIKSEFNNPTENHVDYLFQEYK